MAFFSITGSVLVAVGICLLGVARVCKADWVAACYLCSVVFNFAGALVSVINIIIITAHT